MKPYLAICMSLLLLSSCTNEEKKPEAVATGPQFTYTPEQRAGYDTPAVSKFIADSIDASKLSTKQKVIFDGLNKGTIDFNKVFALSLERSNDRSYKQQDNKKVTKRMYDISRGINFKKNSDAFDFKVALDQSIKRTIKKDIEYNFTSPAVGDFVLDGKMQCLSGTHTYIQARFQRFGARFMHQDYSVVILTEGHIQPGIVAKDEDGYSHLFGIEMTTEGESLVYFGDEVGFDNENVRVVNTLDYMIFDALQDAFINPKSVIAAAHERVEDEFGFATPIERVEELEPVSVDEEDVAVAGEVDEEADELENDGSPESLRRQINAQIKADLMKDIKKNMADSLADTAKRMSEMRVFNASDMFGFGDGSSDYVGKRQPLQAKVFTMAKFSGSGSLESRSGEGQVESKIIRPSEIRAKRASVLKKAAYARWKESLKKKKSGGTVLAANPFERVSEQDRLEFRNAGRDVARLRESQFNFLENMNVTLSVIEERSKHPLMLLEIVSPSDGEISSGFVNTVDGGKEGMSVYNSYDGSLMMTFDYAAGTCTVESELLLERHGDFCANKRGLSKFSR